MKFESARDGMYTGVYWGLFLTVGAVIVFNLVMPTTKADKLVTLFGLVPVLAGMIYIYVRTYYIVSDEFLIIHYGPFRQTIKRDRIFSIVPYRSIYSAPALSRDRLQIRYDKFGEVQVSPLDKAGFLEALDFTVGCRPKLSQPICY